MTRLKNKYSHLTNNSISKHAEDSIREKAAVVGVSISISSPFREGVILPYPFASGGRSQEVLQSRTRASVGKEAWDSQCCLGQLLVIFLSPTESSLLFCVKGVYFFGCRHKSGALTCSFFVLLTRASRKRRRRPCGTVKSRGLSALRSLPAALRCHRCF